MVLLGSLPNNGFIITHNIYVGLTVTTIITVYSDFVRKQLYGDEL